MEQKGTKETKYSETIIYKIVCNDLTKTKIYVGHTTNVRRRKCCHKKRSKIDEQELYKYIRENNGWENFTMVEIEKYPCNDLTEARIRERFWYEVLNPKLNEMKPYITPEEIKKNEHIYHQNYYYQHQNECIAKTKAYYEEHKNETISRIKEWGEKNQDKLKQYKSKWYQNNKNTQDYKDKMEEKTKPYNCECGSVCRIDNKHNHFKTVKHINYLKSLL